jgi:hypothetical protein
MIGATPLAVQTGAAASGLADAPEVSHQRLSGLRDGRLIQINFHEYFYASDVKSVIGT